MRDDRLLKLGLGGAVVAALCCFTPLLVVLLGALGLAAWSGWIDVVALPALAGFAALAGHAVLRRARRGVR